MKVQINTPQKNINIAFPKKNIEFGIQRASSGGPKQIFIGDTEPTDPNILIWIDTSGDTPVVISTLITADNKQFITSDNKEFILKEIVNQMLLTNDNKEFIEANNKNFILKEEF